MKHGRPRRCSTPFAYDNHVVWTIGMSEDAIGWRREHAHRVFAAIQSVVAWVDLFCAYRDEIAQFNTGLKDIIDAMERKGMIAP